jgi:deoxyribodipyrimidine photo-lyase
MKTDACIVWFRRDLRVHDNPALDWAIENSSTVIPVYIHSPEEENPWAPGAASRWWLHQSISSLQKSLEEKNLCLFLFDGDSEQVLEEIITDSRASKLVYNRIYEKHLSDRDHRVEQKLIDKVDVSSFDSGLFFSPGSILNNQGLPYRVFTPFYKKVRPMLDMSHTGHITRVNEREFEVGLVHKFEPGLNQTLDSLELLDENGWHQKLTRYWKPGEDQAFELLDNFIDDAVRYYDVERDLPAQDSTSRLSPYLHFGEITPAQIYHALMPLLEGEYGAGAAQSAEIYLKQLIWREFAHHVLWHFPETASEPMNHRYHQKFWRNDSADFDSWCRGETGIPIIDAGMKQLWETGWMHNRVRMIVSSFLTKNLGISWLDGARWFWDTLVDADLANNSMGWQWVAGCGVDAAPYYRIFNPETQARRFDEKSRYIDRWSPEHGEPDYPRPMLDLASSREAAMQRYKQYIRS